MAKTLIGTATTDANGVATITYTATGAGDVTIQVESGNLKSNVIDITDLLFHPPLDGTDNITKWTSLTNKTENGIFYSHGSFLTEGWSNNELWQLDFDCMTTSWKYVGLMPICSEEINPFTDAKATNYAMTTWEGVGYLGGLNASVVNEDSYSKNTATNVWHHMTIKKLSDTQIEIILDETYHSIRNVPNLANLTTLHIGTRDNPSSRNSGGIVQYKNIKVKQLEA